MISCLHCGAETTNGLVLCELCQRALETCFDFFPVYFRNLARWRPGRAGARPVPGSRVLYDGGTTNSGDRITNILDETVEEMLERARTLAKARPHLTRLLNRLTAANIDDAQTVAWLSAAFTRYLPSIATTDWCGDFYTEVKDREALLRRLTETSVPGWYAGACKHCTAGTHAVPGLTWVTCHSCGTTTYARDHLDTILDEARDWVARPMRLAEAVVALVDTEASTPRLHKRISKWGEREQIKAIRSLDEDGDEVGPKRYRLGDVLDRLASEGATRLNEAAATKTADAS